MILTAFKQFSYSSIYLKDMQTFKEKTVFKNYGWVKPSNNLLDAIRAAFITCKVAGLFPLKGFECRTFDVDHIRFTSSILYIVVYGGSIAAQVFMMLISIHDLYQQGVSMRRLSPFMFYLTDLVSILSIYRFGKGMKSLIVNVANVERTLPHTYKEGEKRIVKYCNRILASILLLAAVEHVLYLLHAIDITTECFSLPGEPKFDLEKYYIFIYNGLFNSVPYNHFLGVLFQVLNIQATFVWNFTDIVIIIFSIYLTNHFNNFNKLFKDTENEINNQCIKSTWVELRQQYTKLVKVAKLIDDQINPLVFVSFFVNLFFICQQLFYIFSKLSGRVYNTHLECQEGHSDWKGNLYFIYSLLLLFLRTSLVSFLAAKLHTKSLEPLNALHTIPSTMYTLELQLFMDQIYHSQVGFTGLNMFYVTRGVILTVITTIITYELVLMQYQGKL